MELIYIWIEHFNNIHNKGFNFSKSYLVKYDNERKELTLEKGINTGGNLFHQSFLNVTGIIGRNGSGKTSLFSLIKEVFSNDTLQFNNYIFLVKNEDDKLLIIDETSGHDITFKYGKDIDPPQKTEISVLKQFIDLFYFSNSLSIYDELPEYPGHHDVSTYAWLTSSSRESNEAFINDIESLNSKYPEEAHKKNEDYLRIKERIINYYSGLKYLYRSDLNCQVEFISAPEHSGFDFIPRWLNLYFDYSIIENDIKFYTELGIIEKIKGFQEYINKRASRVVSDDKLLISRFKEELIFLLFIYNLGQRTYYNHRDKDIEIAVKLIIDSDYQDISTSIQEIVSSASKGHYLLGAGDLQDIILNLDNRLKGLELTGLYPNNYSFILTSELKDLIAKIISLWTYGKFCINYHWKGLSAGESALLTIFSRLYSRVRSHLNNNIWLIIDEGELYLHPEWQRHFFNYLHEFIPKFFVEKRIQLILSSHSPFVISDLPQENIILLEKSFDGLCEIIDNNSFANSFGSNIMELLANNFFLKEGFVGEFARTKINDLFKYFLEDSPDEEWDEKKAKDLISNIGDPIVKEYLKHLYSEKFKSKLD